MGADRSVGRLALEVRATRRFPLRATKCGFASDNCRFAHGERLRTPREERVHPGGTYASPGGCAATLPGACLRLRSCCPFERQKSGKAGGREDRPEPPPQTRPPVDAAPAD